MADRHRAGRVLGVRGWAGLLATAVLLTGCAKSDLATQGFNGSELKDAWTVPGTGLRDTDGAAYSLAADTDKPVTLVFFGYTNCPDICSMVLANLTGALARLDDGERERVDVVFVTTDPARDDAAALRRYLDAFDEDYVGLTGPMPEITAVAEGFHVFFENAEKLPTGGYDVVHDDHVFVVDEADEVPLLWSRETSQAQYAADLQLLLKD